jgi:hypothetical protein
MSLGVGILMLSWWIWSDVNEAVEYGGNLNMGYMDNARRQ